MTPLLMLQRILRPSGKKLAVLAAATSAITVAVVLSAASSTLPAKIWRGDYKELRWTAIARPSSSDDVCIDLVFSGRVSATSGGCDFGLNEGEYVSYFADSNCSVRATFVVGPAHPDVARVEITAIVDQEGTKEQFEYTNVLPPPPGYQMKFIVGMHRKFGYVDNVRVFDANGQVLREHVAGLNVDHDWTAEDFC